MIHRFTSVINKEGNWYVAHCVELGVASQGKTIDQAQKNLKEAVELYLEDVKLKKVNPSSYPLITTLEVEYV